MLAHHEGLARPAQIGAAARGGDGGGNGAGGVAPGAVGSAGHLVDGNCLRHHGRRVVGRVAQLLGIHGGGTGLEDMQQPGGRYRYDARVEHRIRDGQARAGRRAGAEIRGVVRLGGNGRERNRLGVGPRRLIERVSQGAVAQLVESPAVGVVVAAAPFGPQPLRKQGTVRSAQPLHVHVVIVHQLPHRAHVAALVGRDNSLNHPVAGAVRGVGQTGRRPGCRPSAPASRPGPRPAARGPGRGRFPATA
nr:hypothetical protein [Tanacetum cinerariifolium]